MNVEHPLRETTRPPRDEGERPETNDCSAQIASTDERGGYTVRDLVAALSGPKRHLLGADGPRDWRERIEGAATDLLVVGLVFLLVVGGYWGLRKLTGDGSLLSIGASLIGYAWDKIGVTAIALVPMAASLAVLLLLIAAEHLKWFRFLSDPRRYLAGIADFAPLFGVLGTMIGLVDVMQTAAFGGGGGGSFSDAVAGMSTGIGQALVSSVVGLTVAILASAGRYAVARDWKDREQGS